MTPSWIRFCIAYLFSELSVPGPEHVIDMHHFRCHFAWWPKFCERSLTYLPSQITGNYTKAPRTEAYRWLWMGYYWKDHNHKDNRCVTPNRMDELVEEEAQRQYAPQPISTHSNPPTASIHSVGIVTFALDPMLEAAVRDVCQKLVTELEKKFMDELFSILPANTVPQEQIDRIYAAMGYESNKDN